MDTPPPDPAPIQPPKSLVALSVITGTRVLVTAALISLLMLPVSDLPENPVELQVTLIGFLALWTVVFGLVFRWQLRRVRKATHPQSSMVEALAIIFVLFLAVFSKAYHLLSLAYPEAFTERLDFFSSAYFSLTILATVGFGDITPVTMTARALTMLQMVLDIVLLGVAVRVVTGAASRALEARRSAEASVDQTDPEP